MDEVFIVYKTDNQHSHASKDVIGVSQFLTGAKALCIEQAQKEGERIDNNDMFNLENIFQTQGYSGKGEFDIEQLTLNELV